MNSPPKSRWYTKTLGADDNFFLMCAEPPQSRGAAFQRTQARSRRHRDPGRDHTPSYRGQLAQICRSGFGGRAECCAEKQIRAGGGRDGAWHRRREARRADVRRVRRHQQGAGGRRLRRILLPAAYPPPRPWARLRLDTSRRCRARQQNAFSSPTCFSSSIPNQYLPETGYLLCGEPTLITANGPEPLTKTPRLAGADPKT